MTTIEALVHLHAQTRFWEGKHRRKIEDSVRSFFDSEANTEPQTLDDVVSEVREPMLCPVCLEMRTNFEKCQICDKVACENCVLYKHECKIGVEREVPT